MSTLASTLAAQALYQTATSVSSSIHDLLPPGVSLKVVRCSPAATTDEPAAASDSANNAPKKAVKQHSPAVILCCDHNQKLALPLQYASKFARASELPRLAAALGYVMGVSSLQSEHASNKGKFGDHIEVVIERHAKRQQKVVEGSKGTVASAAGEQHEDRHISASDEAKTESARVVLTPQTERTPAQKSSLQALDKRNLMTQGVVSKFSQKYAAASVPSPVLAQTATREAHVKRGESLAARPPSAPIPAAAPVKLPVKIPVKSAVPVPVGQSLPCVSTQIAGVTSPTVSSDASGTIGDQTTGADHASRAATAAQPLSSPAKGKPAAKKRVPEKRPLDPAPASAPAPPAAEPYVMAPPVPATTPPMSADEVADTLRPLPALTLVRVDYIEHEDGPHVQTVFGQLWEPAALARNRKKGRGVTYRIVQDDLSIDLFETTLPPPAKSGIDVLAIFPVKEYPPHLRPKANALPLLPTVMTTPSEASRSQSNNTLLLVDEEQGSTSTTEPHIPAQRPVREVIEITDETSSSASVSSNECPDVYEIEAPQSSQSQSKLASEEMSLTSRGDGHSPPPPPSLDFSAPMAMGDVRGIADANSASKVEESSWDETVPADALNDPSSTAEIIDDFPVREQPTTAAKAESCEAQQGAEDTSINEKTLRSDRLDHETDTTFDPEPLDGQSLEMRRLAADLAAAIATPTNSDSDSSSDPF